MDPILAYIRDGKLLPNQSKARNIKVRSSRFTILNDELYKKGVFPTYSKCLGSEDATYVLREIHERVYGNHSSP